MNTLLLWYLIEFFCAIGSKPAREQFASFAKIEMICSTMKCKYCENNSQRTLHLKSRI